MKSIRSQLTRRLVLGALLIAGGGGATAYLTMRAASIRQFDEALLGKAQSVCGLTEQESDGRVNVDLADVRPLGFGEDDAEHFFQVRLVDGTTVMRSPSLHADELPLLTADAPTFADIALPHGVAGRAVAFTFTPRDADDRSLPTHAARATLIVAASRRSLDASLRTTLAALALSTGVLLLSAWLLVPRELRRGLRPLDELGERVAHITADSLATRFPAEGMPAELTPIAHRLNELLARIGASFERERRFSADLAHELRTPLAELRSQAELALKWPDARAASADAETLAIAQRMEHLVTRLLALARAEGGHAGAVRERIALEPAVQAAWRPLAARAAARQLRVSFHLEGKITIESDPALLREILANLVANAVDYAPAGGAIEVRATRADGPFALAVTNAAPDLDAADVEKMFARFWRKEAARSDDEHAGLGLALARSYAHALGCELHATLDSSARLTLRLSGIALGDGDDPAR